MTELRTPWSLTRRLQPWRVLLYAALVLLAAVFLLPVYVMLANSFKPLDEIRSGHLLALLMPRVAIEYGKVSGVAQFAPLAGSVSTLALACTLTTSSARIQRQMSKS